MITASALPRLRRCRAVVSLPQYPNPDSDYSRRGKAIHSFIETGEIDPEFEEECSRIKWDDAGLEEARHEVSYAWNSVTGECRELGVGLGRKYDLKPNEIAGTADIIVGGDSVIDIKTGFKRSAPAAENWQVLFFAMCLSRIRSLDRVDVALYYLQEDGSWWVDMGTVDTFTLLTFEAELRAALKGGPPTPGEWCRYCPSFSACPAKIGLIIATFAGQGKNILVPHIDAENAADAYERLNAVKEVCGHVEAALKAYAAEATIPLGDGRYYGVVETIKEDIDAEKASELLGVVPGAFRFSTSKTAITKVYGKEALERLRAAGAVVRRSIKTVREFTRK